MTHQANSPPAEIKIISSNTLNNEQFSSLSSDCSPESSEELKYGNIFYIDCPGFFDSNGYLSKNKSMSYYLNKSENFDNYSYSDTLKLKMILAISTAMQYMHNHKIFHRNLKPCNILLNDNFSPIITDFGYSKNYTNKVKLKDQSYYENHYKHNKNYSSSSFCSGEYNKLYFLSKMGKSQPGKSTFLNKINSPKISSEIKDFTTIFDDNLYENNESIQNSIKNDQKIIGNKKISNFKNISYIRDSIPKREENLFDKELKNNPMLCDIKHQLSNSYQKVRFICLGKTGIGKSTFLNCLQEDRLTQIDQIINEYEEFLNVNQITNFIQFNKKVNIEIQKRNYMQNYSKLINDAKIFELSEFPCFFVNDSLLKSIISSLNNERNILIPEKINLTLKNKYKKTNNEFCKSTNSKFYKRTNSKSCKKANNKFCNRINSKFCKKRKSSFLTLEKIIQQLKVAVENDDEKSALIFLNMIIYKRRKVNKRTKRELAECIKNLASTNNPTAMLIYAILIEKRFGVRHSTRKALHLFKKAAEKGNVSAMFHYAMMLYRRNGVKANDEEAAHYFLLAAKKGNVDSMYFYAVMLENGRGVQKNEIEALLYYKMAAENGSRKGKEKYNDLKKKLELGDSDISFSTLYRLLNQNYESLSTESLKERTISRLNVNLKNFIFADVNHALDVLKTGIEIVNSDEKDNEKNTNYKSKQVQISDEKINQKNTNYKSKQVQISDEKINQKNTNYKSKQVQISDEKINQKNTNYKSKHAHNNDEEDKEKLFKEEVEKLINKSNQKSTIRITLNSDNESINRTQESNNDLSESEKYNIQMKMLINSLIVLNLGNQMILNNDELIKFIYEMLNNNQDIEEIRKSAQKDDDKSMLLYGFWLFTGQKIKQDQQEGARYIKNAAKKRNVIAMNLYSLMLYLGLGVEKNKEEAKLFIEKANEEKKKAKFEKIKNKIKNAKILYNLATYLRYEKGYQLKAFEIYKKSAQEQNSDAMYELGMMLKNGEGVLINTDTALYYFIHSYLNGNEHAFKQIQIFSESFYIAQQYEKIADLLLLKKRLINEMNKIENTNNDEYKKYEENVKQIECLVEENRKILNDEVTIESNGEEIAHLLIKHEKYNRAQNSLNEEASDQNSNSLTEKEIELKKVQFDLYERNKHSERIEEARKLECSTKQANDHPNEEELKKSQHDLFEHNKFSEEMSRSKRIFDKQSELSVLNSIHALKNRSGISVNTRESSRYFKFSPEKGNSDPMFSYSIILDPGEGISTSKKEAEQYFKMSTDRGVEYGMLNPTMTMKKGDGNSGNKNEIEPCLKMAEDNERGNEIERFANWMNRDNTTEDPNNEDIQNILNMANEGGTFNSIMILALMVYQGICPISRLNRDSNNDVVDQSQNKGSNNDNKKDVKKDNINDKK